MDCIVREPVNIYDAEIGNRVRIGPFVEIQRACVIGDDSVISSHSFLCGGLRVGKGVFFGHGVLTCNDRYPRANDPNFTCIPPIIHDGAVIGSGAILLPGVVIGSHALIGAGVVVTRDIPEGLIYNGKKPVPCEYEARPRDLAEPLTIDTEWGAYCKTHGWDCPNVNLELQTG